MTRGEEGEQLEGVAGVNWFDLGHVKSGMDFHGSGELQADSRGVNNALNGEGANKQLL